ncbi:hypothetical protein E4U22_002296 [Claviceps purpurea]|nr:hypothetical protein E4U22_002296 [Claviceps purpurea]
MRDVPQFTRDLLKSCLDTPSGSNQRFKTPFSFSRSGWYLQGASGGSGWYIQDASGAKEHQYNFVRTIAKDCNDEALCDLEIVCGGRSFPAHRNVVCLHSSVIRAAFLGPWKEAARGMFEIKETSHTLVRRMLDYIYTGDYDNFDSSILVKKDHLSPQEVAELDIADYLTLHMKMMELGDMYMVEGLNQLTSEKFAEHLASQTPRDILVTIVPKVYALKIDSSDTIREVVVSCMSNKISRLPLEDDVEESLKDVAKNVPEFTCDLVKSYIKAMMLLLGNSGRLEDFKRHQEMYPESEDVDCTFDEYYC